MKWNVKQLGRMAEDAEGTMWLAAPASEISFRVKGASFLDLRLAWDGFCPELTPERIWPRCAVYLDGNRILDERLTVEEKVFSVFRSEGPENHTVRLVKLSECSHSLVGLKEIRTDGTTEALPEKELKIEFIGDSITCGYGVEGTEKDTFSTATENAEKSHAFLTGQALDADTALTAYSGCGLISGYTEGEINEGNLMIPIYEKAGRNSWPLPGGRRLQEIPWDFSRFRPDYIVIDLGNNDLSWTREMPEREEMFRQKYREFLSMVRRNNPKARILCVLGVEGEKLTAAMVQAAEEWKRETGDKAIRHMLLEKQDTERDGAGADMHPSEITQRKMADTMLAALKSWMRE